MNTPLTICFIRTPYQDFLLNRMPCGLFNAKAILVKEQL